MGKLAARTLALFISAALIPISLSCQRVDQQFQFPNSEIRLQLDRSSKLKYSILKGTNVLQSVTLDSFTTNSDFVQNSNGSFSLRSSDSTILFELIPQSSQVTHLRISRNFLPRTARPMDCVNLNIGNVHWYGGPQDRHQYWPVERLTFTNYSYVTKEDHNAGIAERYWLNSDGVFIYVEDQTPLFIEQNSPGHENQLCFSAQSVLPYSRDVSSITFRYQIGIASNAKEAHMYAVQNILGKTSAHPDERMVQHPIWSTWAIYKTAINDTVVQDFANAIVANHFNNSQLEIDDDWEDCYGALTFRKSKFPNIKQLTDQLKAQGFRVTLWIHPFINKNCEPTYTEAKQKGYLVVDHNNNPDTQWWNSGKGEAAYVDFSNPDAVQWYVNRLKRLQTEDGIDSFKFDAGESSWIPLDSVLQGSADFHPSTITRDYIRTVSQFGPLVEVRSGQGTQNLPIFVRMIDKDSEWDWRNGLVTLITTLLQLNMNGYPFVLPDMIGGNGYDNKSPTKELFIRWLQANTFMPSLQFSYVPWQYDEETVKICQKFTELHSKYTPLIMERFKLATETGEPVNPPLWWTDPEDKVAQGIYDRGAQALLVNPHASLKTVIGHGDTKNPWKAILPVKRVEEACFLTKTETVWIRGLKNVLNSVFVDIEFLLGDKIIAAPVIEDQARQRDIYLPKGKWKDGNTDVVHQGPLWLMDYPAPLDVLPYFERQD